MQLCASRAECQRKLLIPLCRLEGRISYIMGLWMSTDNLLIITLKSTPCSACEQAP